MKLLDRRMVFLILIQLFIAVGIILSIRTLTVSEHKSNSYLLERANRLEAAGVIDEAIRSYENYLKATQLDDQTRAKLSFHLGELYERVGTEKKALTAYFSVPKSEDSFYKKAAKRIVVLLERAGNTYAAKQVLKSGVALKKDSVKKGGKVVATINDKPLSLSEVEKEWELVKDLPQVKEMKMTKKQFAAQFVAEQAVLEKAYQQELQLEQDVLTPVKRLERQLLIQKVLSKEVFSKVQIDEQDVKNYFKANQERYLPKGKKSVAYKQVKDRVVSDYKMEKGKTLYQSYMQKILTTEGVEFHLDVIND